MLSKRSIRLALISAAIIAAAVFIEAPRIVVRAQDQSKGYDQGLFRTVQWRSIGPFRGGRSVAVAGVPSQPMVYYFGATGGGVWKTVDGGNTWEPVSDRDFKTGTVGAIAIADSDPNVVYVGMGETPVRGNVSHGDGVYKSVDAGRTWKHVGLDDTRHIGRVRIHPKNPDIVYVAALGHLFGPGDQRGVFRSKDGGKTWDRVLNRGDKAGAVDLVLDPSNPNVLYAGFWEVKRTPYSLESGGPGSGIFKTTDGGDNWTEITRSPGLPRGVIGKIGIAVSPQNSDRVWAIVEAEDGGVFRSDNGGRSWVKVNEQRNLRQRAWYYTRIYADPTNVDSVYVLNTGFYKSIDGGRTYTSIGVPHGDNHDLWLAPNDSNRMINSNDGGANVSFNGGRTWSEQDIPTAQFYRVTTDNDFPYNIYGAQQDNSTVRIASRTTGFGISRQDWYDVGGGESGWIAPYLKDTQIVFAGSYGGLITRDDHRTGQSRNVTVWPDNPMGWGAEGMKFRFQWNFPIVFSPHDGETLFAGGNMLFKTTNQGQSWLAISPDLTRNDKTKFGSSGGPITKDNTSVEYYGTIFTLMESPVQKGVIWTGSDDGLVHLTKDSGKNWENVTPKEMPEWIQINSLDASSFDAGTAYVAATMYKSDDFRPYLYKTSDFGKTWKKIVNGIPNNAFTRVIREDPNKRGLLYAGTETGIYISFNDGESWQSLQLNLPVVPITDIAVHKRDKDLVVATQGRSFWIIDDLNVLHQMADAANATDGYLYKPEDTWRADGGGPTFPQSVPTGSNPSNGAVIHYYLRSKPTGAVTIEFLDASGASIRKVSSGGGEGAPPASGGEEFVFFGGGGGQSRATAEAGVNRFVWDMRHAEAVRFPGLIMWAGSTTGPRAVPGVYTVKLTVGDKALTQTFEYKKDPRLTTTQAEFQKQFDLLIKIREKLSATHEAIIRIRDVRRQIQDLSGRLRDDPSAKAIIDAGKALNEKMTRIEEELYQTKNQSSQDPLNFPIRLNNKLAALTGVVGGSDSAPTDQSYAVYDDIAGRIDVQLKALDAVWKTDLANFNKLARDQNVPAVIVRKP